MEPRRRRDMLGVGEDFPIVSWRRGGRNLKRKCIGVRK